MKTKIIILKIPTPIIAIEKAGLLSINAGFKK